MMYARREAAVGAQDEGAARLGDVAPPGVPVRPCVLRRPPLRVTQVEAAVRVV